MWNDVSGQSTDSTIRFVGLNVQYGFIIPHAKEIQEIADSNPYGAKVEFSRLRYTQKSWNACNCYGETGVAVAYFNLNNPEELGSGWNIYLFSQPRFTYGKIWLSLRAGMGFSYLTHYYDAATNPRNQFFSRPISGILLLGLNARTSIGENWILGLSANYYHISNGGTRQPNKGMNYPTLGIGAEYVMKPYAVRPRSRAKLMDKKVKYFAGMFTTSRAIDETVSSNNVRKMVIGVQAGGYKPVSYRSAMGLALESYHDGTINVNSDPGDNISPWVVSGLLQHHLLFGKFDFSQSLGFYLHEDYSPPKPLFQRYAIEYRIIPSLQVGFSLKAHLQVAEQMDIRAALVF